jgi:hypothetical protein
MEGTNNRAMAVEALRAAIRSVRRGPTRLPWPGDDRFYIELQMPRFAERLDLQMAAQLVLAGIGSVDRFIQLLIPTIIAFRLPAEDEDGQLHQAIYNAEPLPDLPILSLTPADLFADTAPYNATSALMTFLITHILELAGRTPQVAEGLRTITDLFPAAPTHTNNLLEQNSS